MTTTGQITMATLTAVLLVTATSQCIADPTDVSQSIAVTFGRMHSLVLYAPIVLTTDSGTYDAPSVADEIPPAMYFATPSSSGLSMLTLCRTVVDQTQWLISRVKRSSSQATPGCLPGEIPILFNDHHVYANQGRPNQSRVLTAIIENGRVLVPFRSIFEDMGATVTYDAASKTVAAEKAGASVQLTLGKSEAVINGESRPLDVPSEIYKGMLVVPLRVVSEVLGAYVEWVPDRRIVVVRYTPATPPPPLPPTPPPAPAPTSVPTRATPHATPGLVHDSVLSAFNRDHPEHVAGEPYFGRYSYVLLHSGDESVQEKNRSLITILVDRFVATGSTIQPGAPRDVENPWGYNIFFLPVHDVVAKITVTTKSAVVDQLLSQYNYAKARSIRDNYCAALHHQLIAECTAPYDSGPIILTFIGPLPLVTSPNSYPPALAYDFTSVGSDQLHVAIDIIERKIVIPASIVADEQLPPTFVIKYVAPLLNSIADALTASIVGVRVFLDKGLKGHN